MTGLNSESGLRKDGRAGGRGNLCRHKRERNISTTSYKPAADHVREKRAEQRGGQNPDMCSDLLTDRVCGSEAKSKAQRPQAIPVINLIQ